MGGNCFILLFDSVFLKFSSGVCTKTIHQAKKKKRHRVGAV